VQITGVPAQNEYHKLTTFSVLSDADGYYPCRKSPELHKWKFTRKTVGIQTLEVTTHFVPIITSAKSHLSLSCRSAVQQYS
jgi:hypothetical protein